MLELARPRRSEAYDPLAWNVFGGKRVPRQERSAETTGVRCFLESVGQVEGVPDTEELYTWISSSFSLWYPMGKMAVMVMEVPEDKLADFPQRYADWKSEAGNQEEFRILPMGIKKYNKQIDEVVWVGVADLIPEMKGEASDLLKNLLEVGNFKDFLLGTLDLEKLAATDTVSRPPAEPAPSKGKGKGKGYGKGGSRGGKGYGGGGKGYNGYSGGYGYEMDFGFGGKGGMYGGGKFGGKDNGYMGGMQKGMQMPMPMPIALQMMMAPPMQPPMPPAPMPAGQGQSAEVQRQMYGEQLYLLVQPLSPSPYLAQKITGMLLELPQNELLLNLTNMDELSRRVSEALEVLKEDGIVS
ncbi:unnamed protein product [Prorocentrum cordatum]|uniref:PABC domain-containing protein n=1 Tax=Prorocentrum cordatum TaxID=2364126 RepID=A0ABN9UVH1_9DINO|nr:unnamed protein product [Polarella glacialis]